MYGLRATLVRTRGCFVQIAAIEPFLRGARQRLNMHSIWSGKYSYALNVIWISNAWSAPMERHRDPQRYQQLTSTSLVASPQAFCWP
jgi:hypothetical protein